MVLEDITGKPVPAIDIFSLSIHALVKHLMGLLHTQGTGLDIHEIRWVLTVPAIWSDAAKSFMRKSAEKVYKYTVFITRNYDRQKLSSRQLRHSHTSVDNRNTNVGYNTEPLTFNFCVIGYR